jgi:hypothetical protein
MKRTQGFSLAPVAILCAVVLYLVPAGWAQTVELKIDNPPSNNMLDGIYVGSYGAQNLTSGGSVQIICDDFADHSNSNPTNYTTNTFSTLGNTLWGSFLTSLGYSPGQVTTLYEEAAWLAVGMLGQTGLQQGYYSYAIWAIFDPLGVAQWLTKSSDSGACNAVFGMGSWNGWGCNASTTNKGGLVEGAMSMSPSLNPSDFANVRILTPQGCKSWGGALIPGTCPEQEFFEVVPEGGATAVYLMLAGLVCFGAMFFRSRLQSPVTHA